MTTSSGFSYPRISPTTFSCSTGPPILIRHTESHAHFPWILSSRQARQPHRILARHHCLGNFVDLAVQRICVPVKQQPFACAHPKNRGGAALQRVLDDFRRSQVFIEEIGPRRANVAMHQQNRAFNRRASPRKIVLGPVTHIDEACFNAARWGCRRPALGHKPHSKLHRSQQFEPCIAFAPRHRQRVLLRVNLHALRRETQPPPTPPPWPSAASHSRARQSHPSGAANSLPSAKDPSLAAKFSQRLARNSKHPSPNKQRRSARIARGRENPSPEAVALTQKSQQRSKEGMKRSKSSRHASIYFPQRNAGAATAFPRQARAS